MLASSSTGHGNANIGSGASSSSSSSSTTSTNAALFRVIDQYDDASVLLSGVFENFLKISYTDPCMSKTCTVLDIFSCMDILSNHNNMGNSFNIAPFACMSIHSLCSVDYRMSISWPNKVSNAN